MPDSNLSSKAGVITPIELQQGICWSVSRLETVDVENTLSHLGCSQAFTIESEETQFGNSVEDPERAVEFKTVDDDWLSFEADVLGPEISVRFNDPAFPNALVEEIRMPVEEFKLTGDHETHEIGG